MIQLSSDELTEMARFAADEPMVPSSRVTDEEISQLQITDEEIQELENGMIGCRCYPLLSRLRVAEARVKELESAISKHRDQTGHNMCWENDFELYEALKDGGDNLGPHRSLPYREEFMTRCGEYYESRLIPLKKVP